MKKLTFKSVLFTLLLVMPIISFAAISEQNGVDFKSGSEVLETYTKILNFCLKNGTDIASGLGKLKAQPSEQNTAQNQMNYSSCCVNVSGGWGEYAYIHGNSYCIPPC